MDTVQAGHSVPARDTDTHPLTGRYSGAVALHNSSDLVKSVSQAALRGVAMAFNLSNAYLRQSLSLRLENNDGNTVCHSFQSTMFLDVSGHPECLNLFFEFL